MKFTTILSFFDHLRPWVTLGDPGRPYAPVSEREVDYEASPLLMT